MTLKSTCSGFRHSKSEDLSCFCELLTCCPCSGVNATLAEAHERPTCTCHLVEPPVLNGRLSFVVADTAINIWEQSAGCTLFGPVSFSFYRSYVADLGILR